MFYLVCFFVIILSYLGILLKKNTPEALGHIDAIMKREKRLAATAGLILLVLLLTFLPAMLCPIVLKMNGIDSLRPSSPLFGFLLSLNAFLSPLVNLVESRTCVEDYETY